MTFKDMYEVLISQINPKVISPIMKMGNYIAMVKTKSGLYIARNVSGRCGLDFCAEKNAIVQMLHNGETEIESVLTVSKLKEIEMPCGSCRELMMQLGPFSVDIKLIMGLEEHEYVRLGELSPMYWGDRLYSKQSREHPIKEEYAEETTR